MTTSPLTDAIIVELRRLAAMKDKIFAAQCLGRIAHELHHLRYPTHEGELDELDSEEALNSLVNAACLCEDKIMLVGPATDDQKEAALDAVERHAHGLRGTLDPDPMERNELTPA